MFSKRLFSYLYNKPKAHCESVLSGSITVGAFCTEFGETINCGQKQEVLFTSEILIHPEYNIDNNLNKDFALVRLNQRSTITPVNIDDGSYAPTYTQGTYNALKQTLYHHYNSLKVLLSILR